MLILFYQRKFFNEETPILDGIGEDGKVRRFKFPYILKSKKRNSFFLIPGSIWNCSFRDVDKIMVPNEYTLSSSPIDANPEYNDLSLLTEFIKPLERLWKTGNYIQYFQWYFPLLSGWLKFSFQEKKILIIAALLSFCQKEGLFPSEYECSKCNNLNVYLHQEIGIICTRCDPSQNKLNLIPVYVLQAVGKLQHSKWPTIADSELEKVKELLSNIILQTR